MTDVLLIALLTLGAGYLLLFVMLTLLAAMAVIL
jgi:hypothetical protein